MTFPVEEAEIDEDTKHGKVIRPWAELGQYRGTMIRCTGEAHLAWTQRTADGDWDSTPPTIVVASWVS